MFDLTKHLEAHRRQKLAGAIKEAARLIAQCPDERKQWEAMRELRQLQAQMGYPSV